MTKEELIKKWTKREDKDLNKEDVIILESETVRDEKYDSVFRELCLANALGSLLKDMEGIIAQGEDLNGKMTKVLISRENQEIKLRLVDNLILKGNTEIGSLFWMKESI